MNITDAINKSLFFFGAGASYDSGCKLSSGMLEDLKRKISSKDDETFNKPEKEALKFLLSRLEYHSEWRTLETAENFKFTPNIEELAFYLIPLLAIGQTNLFFWNQSLIHFLNQ